MEYPNVPPIQAPKTVKSEGDLFTACIPYILAGNEITYNGVFKVLSIYPSEHFNMIEGWCINSLQHCFPFYCKN
jgi:hypothetical protein